MINRLKRTALILALIFLLLCGSAVALMFHRTETIRNDLEPARVSCAVYEKADGVQYTQGEHKVSTKSSIQVQNTGNIDAYLRVRLVSYWVNENGEIGPVSSQAPTVQLASGWIAGSDNTFYFQTPVKSTGYTGEMLAGDITLGTKTVGKTTYYQVVEVFADAIQSEPSDAAASSWKVTISNGKITNAN